MKDFLKCLIAVLVAMFTVGFMFGLGSWVAWKLVGLIP